MKPNMPLHATAKTGPRMSGRRSASAGD